MIDELYCLECKSKKIVFGCPYCLREKVLNMEKELNYYKRELGLIKE
tara:strand:+ start:631 stop:771 length:141 start_codon:yes stop_codon:yes gene_type:complete